eukprot:8998684-Alexandrium_andersonii.AAC.1
MCIRDRPGSSQRDTAAGKRLPAQEERHGHAKAKRAQGSAARRRGPASSPQSAPRSGERRAPPQP